MQTTCEPLPRTRNHGEAHKRRRPRLVVQKSAPARPHEPRGRFIVNAAPGEIQKGGAQMLNFNGPLIKLRRIASRREMARPLTALCPLAGRGAVRGLGRSIRTRRSSTSGANVKAPARAARRWFRNTFSRANFFVVGLDQRPGRAAGAGAVDHLVGGLLVEWPFFRDCANRRA